ncbi:hypothetical protein Droror1_Dr00006680 [Drosera rotundifolia]
MIDDPGTLVPIHNPFNLHIYFSNQENALYMSMMIIRRGDQWQGVPMNPALCVDDDDVDEYHDECAKSSMSPFEQYKWSVPSYQFSKDSSSEKSHQDEAVWVLTVFIFFFDRVSIFGMRKTKENE